MIRSRMGWALFASMGLAASASASNVLVLSSGNSALDSLVKSSLESRGHTADIGPQFTAFTSAQSLAAYDVVYFQANVNYLAGDMPNSGQTALKAWISAGGGLVTSEWVVNVAGTGLLQSIRGTFAVTPNIDYRNDSTATYTIVTSNPVMRNGLPVQFPMPLTSYDGTEGRLVPKSSAITFYKTEPFVEGPGAGVVGGTYGAGRVIHLSTTFGTAQLEGLAGKFLLGNAVTWAARDRSVLVISSGLSTLDNQVRSIIEGRGFEVTIGPKFSAFDGSVDLNAYKAVYLQANTNWMEPDMPANGQTSLNNFVVSGGGLVTSEWVGYLAAQAGYFQFIQPLLPVTPSTVYRDVPSTTYTQQATDPILQLAVPNFFTMNLTSYDGTETRLAAKPGATQYYSTTAFPEGPGAGVVGWKYVSGRVLSFSTTCGPAQLAPGNAFGVLFGNAFNWVTAPPEACYPDCNHDGALSIADFGCFQSKFVAADPYADCNQSGTFTIADFGCFQSKFAAGCP